MQEILRYLQSLNISDLVLCAAAVVILDLFAIAMIFVANRESQLCRKRWAHVSACVVLRHEENNYPLEADEILLGRHISADIRLTNPSVSRYHAVMTVTNGVWSITDLDSRHGTYVNGHRVKQAKVYPGDVIRLGDVQLHVVSRSPQKGGNHV